MSASETATHEASSSPEHPAIDRKTVAHVANLARLGLTPDEEERYCTDLGRILAMVAQLDELDLSGVSLDPAQGTPMHLRPDVIKGDFDRSIIFEHAPDIEEGAFKVPQILVAAKAVSTSSEG